MKKTEKKTEAAKQTAKEFEETIRRIARRGIADAKAMRAAKYGRWAPVADGFEKLVHSALDIAENAVRGLPRQHAKVQHVRRVASARFAGQAGEPVDVMDLAFTVGLLVQLAEGEFGDLGLSTVPDALLAGLDARCPSKRGLSSTFMAFVSPHTRL